jgi:hypothetical protein
MADAIEGLKTAEMADAIEGFVEMADAIEGFSG